MRRLHLLCGYQTHISVALWLSAFATPAMATGELRQYDAQIVAPGAPVLSGPGENFYPTDTLAQGEVVEVYRELPNGWLGIRPPDDSFSWLFGRHLKLLDNGLAETDSDGVKSRIGSRVSEQRNAVQVLLKKGEVVEIIGEQTVDGQTWYKIAPPSGEFRWIHKRHVARTDALKPDDTVAPPVVTIPMGNDDAVPDAAPVVLVADSQPAADQNWRAAPTDTAAAAAENPVPLEVAAPPLAATSDAAKPTNGSTPANTTPPPTTAAPARQPIGPVADGLARQLTDLEMRLSRIVAEAPATWQIEPLRAEAERLLTLAPTVDERTAVNSTLAKIDRFAAIGRRYRFVGPVGSGPGVPPLTTVQPGQSAITPLVSGPTGAMATGVTAEGQRYDAVGILRPVVSKRPGAPQFALLNERGQVVSFVTPTPDVNLQPYLGHRIGVTGNRGFIPEFQRAHVTAGRVAPLDERLVR